MKIFIDTANIEEIKKVATYGFVAGVTTNPSLMAKHGEGNDIVIPRICELIDGPISAEVLSETKEGMIAEARELVKIHPNVVVKIPMTPLGLEVVTVLSKEQIKTNVTLIFNATQALFAAKCGATYVSPFIGRIDDLGYEGITLVEQIYNIFQIHGIKSEIIAASIRTVNDVIDSALAGAHIATLPYTIIEKSMKHILTDAGLDIFAQDAQKIK